MRAGGRNNLTAHIVTMGCAKNEVDSAKMEERLQDAGIRVVDDPARADAIIVNTCSFIRAATEESLEMVFDMLGLDNVASGDSRVIVTGCMPSRYGDDLSESLHEVKTFVPCDAEDDIATVVKKLFPGRMTGESPLYGRAHALRQTSYSAYVKISDGCDRFCSYCTIPSIRGRYRSFAYEAIRDEVAARVAAGAREIVLIAQDTGRWGQDFQDRKSLAWLMGHLAEEFGTTWFRVMYLQPEGIDDEMIETIRTHGNICPYLDIPLQHVEGGILERMHRKGSYAVYLELVERLRREIPGICLRTTVIAGFPGETEADFDLLCDFIEEAEFDYVGVFPYSREEGTKAAELPNQLDEQVKLERAQIVRDTADRVSEGVVRSRIGRNMDVLVLGREEDGQLYGRCKCQAPDVDGVTYLSSGEPGEIVSVTITDTLMYEMEGE